MIWNIEYQVAGLVLMLILFGMNIGLKKINFRSEKSFTKLLIFVSCSIFLDISSIFAINYRYSIGIILCEVICKAYLFSIVVVAWQASLFAVTEIRYTFATKWVYASTIPIFVQIFCLLLMPISFYAQDGAIYTYGASVVFTYVYCLVYLFATLIMIMVLKSQIAFRRRFAIGFWIASWIITASIQYVNNRVLIVSFSMACACVYMYIKLENPERFIDSSTNSFNMNGFYMVLPEDLFAKRRRALVAFNVSEISRLNEAIGSRALEILLNEIAKFIEELGTVDIFKFDDSVYCVAFENRIEAELGIDKIIRRFERPWVVDEKEIEVNTSLTYIPDITVYDSVETIEETLRYFIKESVQRGSGNILTVDDSELESRQRSIEVRKMLEWAFENDGIEVYYQPIYDIKNGKFTSLEALVRARDITGRQIPPGEFIEVAERNGLILRIGTIVFRKVCEFIQRTHIENYGIEYIEVNLSVVQCMQENLARDLEDIMGEFNVPPYRINFEITESAAANSKKMLERNMSELISYGSDFSLDDYGSGYSNLSNVVGLPLKIIKIDKTMVDDFFKSEKVKIATKCTIDMIHKLGMEIVVEGVESESQYLEFKKLDVEFIQGYYFSRPLPKDQVVTFIREWM